MCEDVKPPAYYYQMVEPFRDKWGLITQKDFDGGDASHRTGLFYLGLYLNYQDDDNVVKIIKKDFLKDLKKLKVDEGTFIRHPDPNMWYSNPGNFSRDQTTPLIVALGVFGEKDEIKANFKNLIYNYGFYPNTLKNWTNQKKVFPLDFQDFAAFSDYGAYIRALDYKFLYPVLMLTDAQLLGSSLIRVLIAQLDQDDSSDDINFSVHLIQSELNMPTPLSKLAKWIYRNKLVNQEYKKENPVYSYWKYYFRHNGHNRPPIDELFKCPINYYIYNRFDN